MMFSSIGDFFPVMPKSGNLDDNKTKFRNIDFFEATPRIPLNNIIPHD